MAENVVIDNVVHTIDRDETHTICGSFVADGLVVCYPTAAGVVCAACAIRVD